MYIFDDFPHFKVCVWKSFHFSSLLLILTISIHLKIRSTLLPELLAKNCKTAFNQFLNEIRNCQINWNRFFCNEKSYNEIKKLNSTQLNIFNLFFSLASTIRNANQTRCKKNRLNVVKRQQKNTEKIFVLRADVGKYFFLVFILCDLISDMPKNETNC